MKISRKGIELIKSFEAFISKLYICPAGKKTIGYGHVIRGNEDYTEISKSMAMNLLKQDITIAENAVKRNIEVPLSQNQYDVLVSFTFNVGAAALQRSSLRQKINYDSSPDEIYFEFQRWNKVAGKESIGLTKRREIEGRLFIVDIH